VTLIQTADNENPTDCGPGFTGGGGDEFHCGFDANLPIQQLRQQRQAMLQELAAEGANSQSYSALTLKRCIETIEALIGQKMLAPDSEDPGAGKENAISFFTSEHMDFKDMTTAYGIMVAHGELARAGAFLSSLNTQGQEQSTFVGVQNINLAYLSQPNAYELSAADSAFLSVVGRSNGAFGGYARSLYEVLTGQRIEVEIPDVSTEERQGEPLHGHVGFSASLYPNPSRSGIFNLQTAGLLQGAVCSALLFDINGREQLRYKLTSDGTYQIGSDTLPTGLYLLVVKDEAGFTLFQSKIAIFH
jgi:hypothetical protein